MNETDPTLFNVFFELETIRCIVSDILFMLESIEIDIGRGKKFRPMKKCLVCDSYGFYEEISQWGCDQCASESYDSGFWDSDPESD